MLEELGFKKEQMQDYVPFSQSKMWALLSEYYEKAGPNAWKHIPSYATSNPYLACAYAECLVAYYKDWVEKNGPAENPLYILELGAGSALFSYYLLQALESVCDIAGIPANSFRLIISDAAKSNIKSWLENKQLLTYFKKGIIDCIHFDLLEEPSMHCQHSKAPLKTQDFQIPPFVICHYVLDSLPTDIFKKDGKRLYATHVALYEPVKKEVIEESEEDDDDFRGSFWRRKRRRRRIEKKAEKKEKVKVKKQVKRKISDIQLRHKNLAIGEKYYKDALLEKSLRDFSDNMPSGYFEYPTATIKMLVNLEEMVGSKFVFSCIDKGVCVAEQYQNAPFPDLVYHGGTFSVMVNFCALEAFFAKHFKGQRVSLIPRGKVKLMLLQTGVDLLTMPRLKQWLWHYSNRVTPLDYYFLYEGFCKTYKSQPVSSWVSMLIFSNWDPHIFSTIADALIERFAELDYEPQLLLVSSVSLIAKQFFYRPGAADIFVQLGRMLNAAGIYQDAIEWFQRSQEIFGENYNNCYYLGETYFLLDQQEDAKECFEKASTFRRTERLNSWLSYLKKAD